MNLLRALLAVSSLTMVSRVLGYARDFFIARVFGAGLLTDAFFVAFKIPNLLRRLFAEGAFSQAFVPLLGEQKQTKTFEETKSLIDAVATLLLLASALAAALGMAAAPFIVYATAPGFAAEPDKFLMPIPSDERYNWIRVRLAAIGLAEMRELVVDAWRMVVPKSVAAAYLRAPPS